MFFLGICFYETSKVSFQSRLPQSWGGGNFTQLGGWPKGGQRRYPIARSVGRFLALSFVASDKGGFCVPCAVLRASCAPGGPEQKQRRRRLARPERPRCPISALRQADGETVFSAASRPDAARARLARPRAATHAERAHKTRPVLSKKDRTAVAFFGFTSYCCRDVGGRVCSVLSAK